MLLSPAQARKLADALLQGGDDGEDAGTPDPMWSPQGGDAGQGGGQDKGRFGRYRVVRLVGHGGMGEVYEAQQDHPARRVALKIVRPDFVSPELARRLDHEARILARLQHPCIAQIFDAGHVETPRGTTPYFAMEFVEGKPLTRFAKDQSLALRARLELFLAVCDAVEHAHRKGVIHRDLKPGNILVDAEGKPRVLDFGLARATDADVRATTIHTEVGKLVGTIPYMSPEQLSGDPDATDTRSDVYALGVVLYELLAGKPPYDIARGPIAEAARIIRDTDPAPLSSIDRVFRGDLETIAAKALEKDKERRYPSVAALAADISRYLNHEPIAARGPSIPYQLTRLVRRHRGAAFGFVMLCIALVTAATGGLLYGFKEQTARRTEGALRAEAERSAATAAAALSFIAESFQTLSAEQSGYEARVSDYLQMASERVRDALIDNPEAQAAVHDAIGKGYYAIGLFSKAVEHARSAWDIGRAGLGESAPLALSYGHNLGWTLAEDNRLDEAQSVIERVLASRELTLGVEHEDTLTTRANLALLLSRRGDHEQSADMLRDVAQARSRVLGIDHPATHDTWSNLGAILVLLRRYEDARDILERELQWLTDNHPAEHPSVVAAQSSLVEVYRRTRQFEKADGLSVQVVAATERKCGPTHRDTLRALNSRTVLLLATGRLQDAADLFAVMLPRAAQSLGEQHPLYFTMRLNCAKLLADLGRFSEAEELLTTLDQLSAAEEASEQAYRERGLAITHGYLYDAWGKPDQAAEWRAKLSPDDPARKPPPPQPLPPSHATPSDGG